MQKVLLLFGGESTEHEVSIVSARNVAAAIDRTKYDVNFGFIDREGRWWLVNDVVDTVTEDAQQLVPQIGEAHFKIGDHAVTPDVIFSVLHGQNGEDGAVQGLLQLLHIPYVGCDIAASAVAMNKHLMKQLTIAQGIAVVPYELHLAEDAAPVYDDIAQKLGGTLFVKPAGSGSSVGVNKATNQAELDAAIAEAHTHDRTVLIEKGINARELEIAVLGNYPNIETSEVGEIKPQGEFYSYDSKYDDASTSETIVPAELPAEVASQLKELAQKVFIMFGGRGMARVDFFLDKDSGDIYLNEVNTLPGFTNISMYPKLWQHAGLSYPELIDRLIQLALK